MSERDKFLTEAMGGCVFSPKDEDYMLCGKCGCDIMSGIHDNYFSTWRMFGSLWEWAQEQEWWGYFVARMMTKETCTLDSILNKFIDPDRFANAVYEFLKDRNEQ